MILAGEILTNRSAKISELLVSRENHINRLEQLQNHLLENHLTPACYD